MFSLRSAEKEDQGDIKQLIRAARINPIGLDWRRFVVAVNSSNQMMGCGQVKPHRDGSRELSSVAVAEHWRGRGVARAIIERLMGAHGPPLWLTCRSSLMPLYKGFGFRLVQDKNQTPYFRRLRRLADAFMMLSASDECLAVMIWAGEKRL